MYLGNQHCWKAEVSKKKKCVRECGYKLSILGNFKDSRESSYQIKLLNQFVIKKEQSRL